MGEPTLTKENVFGNKDNPAPDATKCPPEIVEALRALIKSPELKLDTEQGRKDVIDRFLATANAIRDKIPNADLSQTYGRALSSVNSHFTQVFAKGGVDFEMKAVAASVIPNKKKKPTDPDTFTVQIVGPVKSLEPEHPLTGWGLYRVQNITSREIADKIAQQIRPGSVYKANGGLGKDAPKGAMSGGVSVTIFLNGPSDIDLTPRPDGDAAWADTEKFIDGYFPKTSVTRLLQYDGKSDATSPPQNKLFLIEGGLVDSRTVGGRDGKRMGYSVTVEDSSMDFNTRRTFAGGLQVMLPDALFGMAALGGRSAVIRLLVSGRPREYTAANDQPDSGIKKGQKVKTVGWQAIHGSVVFEGLGGEDARKGDVPNPGAPAVPQAPVNTADLI